MINVFKRHKTSGRKTVISSVETTKEAREICKRENNATSLYWYEFTEDEVTN